MTCADIERVLPEYLDGELEEAPAARCREHIAGCATCGARVAPAEALSRLVRGAPYYSAPDRLRSAIGGLAMGAGGG